MAITVLPYIPANITVHLGPPESNAENVTVSFLDYIKNVASSEIYPTWSTAALRANILSQVSFALNRIYTEFYPSQGYSFNITSTTAYDQQFTDGRNTFQNVDELVEELFHVYIRRPGFAEPLAAHFCNGTTSVCEGLSQWGSEALGRQGYNSIGILRYYFGSNIELVDNAPMEEIRYSYPGAPMRLGMRSKEIQVAQVMLNRIARSYPAIPRVPQTNGVFGPGTRESLMAFQRVFNLTPDGVIGPATWYKMVFLYTSILQLSELNSQGQTYFRLGFQYDEAITYGQQSESVALLQYLLAILSQFYLSLPNIAIDGVFGDETFQAVTALQQDAGLEQSGTVDRETWRVLTDRYLGIDRTVLTNASFFDFQSSSGSLSPEELQDILLDRQGQFPGYPLTLGQNDAERSETP